MQLVKHINRLFFGKDAGSKFIMGQMKAREADLVAESINIKLKQIRSQIDKKQ